MFSYLHLSAYSNINPEDPVLSHITKNIHTTLQGMCILSTSHLLKSHSWGCKAVSSLAAWPVDPVPMTSVVNTMSTNFWGALWSQPGPHRESNLTLSMQKESPGGEGQPDAPKETQDITPSTGHTGNTTEVQKTNKLPWEYAKGNV